MFDAMRLALEKSMAQYPLADDLKTSLQPILDGSTN
jgi:hypothetical protein